MAKKYHVYAAVSGTKYIGEFEAENEEEAIKKAERSNNADAPMLCCECAQKMDVGDLYDFTAEACDDEQSDG